MKRLELKEIKVIIISLAKKINVPHYLYPTYGKMPSRTRRSIANTTIMVDENGYHYLIVEGKVELKHIIAEEIEELLYYIFGDITSDMAFEYEVENSIEDQDYRRIYFQKQLELLSIINQAYYEEKKAELEEQLKINPFNDNL